MYPSSEPIPRFVNTEKVRFVKSYPTSDIFFQYRPNKLYITWDIQNWHSNSAEIEATPGVEAGGTTL